MKWARIGGIILALVELRGGQTLHLSAQSLPMRETLNSSHIQVVQNVQVAQPEKQLPVSRVKYRVNCHSGDEIFVSARY
jgi:hypothetical protein